jgi:hypothetical protein
MRARSFTPRGIDTPLITRYFRLLHRFIPTRHFALETMRATFLACFVAVSALSFSHVSAFNVQTPLERCQVSSTALGVKRETIKMPNQTPMFPYKVGFFSVM